MPFGRPFVVALVLVGVSSGQTPEDALKSRIKAVHFPPLAEQARIQGDIHLSVKSGVVTLLSGHRLLAPIAIESAKAFGSIQDETDLELTYHFVFAETTTSVPTPIVVPKGNAFERAVLRLFGRKTTRVVLADRCQEGAPPANDLKISGSVIEIWIFGRTFCVQTDTATLVAKR
jgi:hypothetical protein